MIINVAYDQKKIFKKVKKESNKILGAFTCQTPGTKL